MALAEEGLAGGRRSWPFSPEPGRSPWEHGWNATLRASLRRAEPAEPRRRWAQSYGIAFGVSLLGVALSLLLESRLAPTPTPLLLAAVTLSTWLGGLGPGLMSTLISAGGLQIIIADHVGVDDGQANSAGLLHLGVFVLVAVLVNTIQERLRNAEHHARRDAERLATLADASHAFELATPDLSKTLRSVAERTADALGDACVISLLSEDGERLDHMGWRHRDAAGQSLMDQVYPDVQHRRGEGVTGRVLNEGRPVFLPKVNPADIMALSKGDYREYLTRYPVHSLLCAPLKARGEVIGTLTLTRHSPNRPYSAGDMEMLRQLADRAALAIDNARLAAYYRVLFENMPAPTVVSDRHARLVDVNPAAARLLGYTRAELRGRNLADIVQECPIGNALHGDSMGHREVRLTRRDGAIIPVGIVTAPVELPNGTVEIGAWHDLSEQRALQQLRDGFVATASHELRTPLTATYAALCLLERANGDVAPDHRQELVAIARRNVQRLRFLVDDLLTRSQFQSGQISIERRELDLRTVIADAIGAVHPLTLRKGQHVEVQLSQPLVIEGDAHRLEQVMVNLLANANAHTPRGSTIWIGGRLDDHEVIVTVRDDGPGIPVGDIESIFEYYARSNSVSGGTGLGLAIARDLVELHGGRIAVTNAPAGGAEFQFALPYAQAGEHDDHQSTDRRRCA